MWRRHGLLAGEAVLKLREGKARLHDNINRSAIIPDFNEVRQLRLIDGAQLLKKRRVRLNLLAYKEKYGYGFLR
jgi:hypothetical protein